MIKATRPLLSMSAIAIAITSLSVHAQEHFRQHEAHVHGHVAFNIAQDGKDLLVEIHAPGADVVGFEHAPSNAEQKQTLKSALSTLNSADTILTLSSDANCKLASAEVTHTLGQHHDEHEEHDHEGHDHDHEGHDHGHHDDHDHDHDKHDHEGHEHHEGGHGEFTIAYQYQCGDMSNLKQIDTAWFEHFSNTKEINANVLTDNAQKALTLAKGENVIKL
ncbi:zinc uptake protein ZrgA [Vibrio gallicus]|uniref:zinc uptake protein ZrgA n=1 Tax=Vibrio gallicus TaxID=190897 RepID=UPI0021C260EB|nr:DUF2796 domain-containing protein [Vibrio gallicus]